MIDPACGSGNFMGVIPESLADTNVFGVELDSISGRIAKQLYQKNDISIGGFEKTVLPESFFDCVVGNVPFGNYGVADKKYDRFHFLIHDYFIARSLDLVRPGGIVALITTSGTMDKQNDSARRYIAERADLLGAIRLPNNAFAENANTQAVTDVLFLQKRESRAVEIPEWVGTAPNEDGITINKYYLSHPEMVLGKTVMKHGRYGDEMTVEPYDSAELNYNFRAALNHFDGHIDQQEISDTDLTEEDLSIPADPSVRNFSYANIDGKVYYRENSRMVPAAFPQTTAERVLAMINMRNTTQLLLQAQLEDESDERIAALQNALSQQYDAFTAKYGLISSTANRRAFSQDSSYCLLSSLEILDEDGNFKRKADIFTKRTIRKAEPVHSVETASEVLAVSIGEHAKVDLPFMSELCGKDENEITAELYGVIFKDPETGEWLSSDEYLSGNVREKLATAQGAAQIDPAYEVKAFIETMRDHPVSYTVFMTMYFTGMREGELLALTPADIDLENSNIRINKSYQRIDGQDLITSPKTAKSNRTVTISSSLKECLADYMAMCYDLKPEDRLFPYTKHFLKHEMNRGCALSGVKRIRIHDLRHSHAAALIEMNVSPKLLQERLGHERIQTTLDTYGHLYPGKQLKVAEQLEQFMNS